MMQRNPKCIFFDWSGTLAKPGQRDIFMYDTNLARRLDTLHPYTLDVLNYLRSKKGIKMGIITNTTKDPTAFYQAIIDTRLTAFIDPQLVFISSDLRYCAKPCPEIFRAAMAKSGCTAAETLYVGDSYWADVLGAMYAGIDVIHITPWKHWRHAHIENLSQLVYFV